MSTTKISKKKNNNNHLTHVKSIDFNWCSHILIIPLESEAIRLLIKEATYLNDLLKGNFSDLSYWCFVIFPDINIFIWEATINSIIRQFRDIVKIWYFFFGTFKVVGLRRSIALLLVNTQISLFLVFSLINQIMLYTNWMAFIFENKSYYVSRSLK